jgi:Fic family protein
MKGIDTEAGKFRKTHEGIFTTAGTVIYHAPPPSKINQYIERLLKYINSDKEKFIPIKAVLAHFTFEKIHPFVDGSGRVGRLLMLAVLKNGGYDFKGILPFEEKIDKVREVYYRMLEEPERDLTNYVEFMLEVIADASSETLKQIEEGKDLPASEQLLPRRSEILKIITEHKIINFDSIKRRFSEVNERTLRYDIKKLTDAKFVKKLGNTRGVYYSIPTYTSAELH